MVLAITINKKQFKIESYKYFAYNNSKYAYYLQISH